MEMPTPTENIFAMRMYISSALVVCEVARMHRQKTLHGSTIVIYVLHRLHTNTAGPAQYSLAVPYMLPQPFTGHIMYRCSFNRHACL